MYFTDDDTNSLVNQHKTVGDLETDFNENWDAGVDATLRNRLSISKGFYSDKYKDELVDQQAARMKDLGLVIPDDVIQGAKLDRQADWNAFTEQAQKLFPDQEWHRYIDLYKMGQQKAIEEARTSRETFEDINRRSSTSGTVGGFLAEAGTSFIDPVNIGVTALTLPFTPARLIGQVALNTVTNTAAEAGIQYGAVRDYLIEQGVSEEEANKQARYGVAMGAVGAAGMTLGIVGIAKAGGALIRKINEGGTPARNVVEQLDSQRTNMTQDEQQWLDDVIEVLNNRDNVQYGTTGTMEALDSIQVHANQGNYRAVGEIFEFNTTPQMMVEGAETVTARMARMEDFYQASRNGSNVFDSLRSRLDQTQQRVLDDLVEEYRFKSTSDMSPDLRTYLETREQFTAEAFFEHDRNALRNQYSNLSEADKAKLDDGDIPGLRDAQINAARDLSKALRDADVRKLQYLNLYRTNPHIQPNEIRNILEVDALRQKGDFTKAEVMDLIPNAEKSKYSGIDNPKTIATRFLNDTIKDQQVKGKKVIQSISRSIKEIEDDLKGEGIISFTRGRLGMEEPVVRSNPEPEVSTPIHTTEDGPTPPGGDQIDHILSKIERGEDVHIDGLEDMLRTRQTLFDDNGVEQTIDDFLDEIKTRENEAAIIEGCHVW